MRTKATTTSGAVAEAQPAQLTLKGVTELGADAEFEEARILARIESAKRIIEKHPQVSFDEAMMQLTPLPRVAYTLKEVAKVLGISYISTYRLVKRGKLKATTELPGRTLIPVREVEKFVNR